MRKRKTARLAGGGIGGHIRKPGPVAASRAGRLFRELKDFVFFLVYFHLERVLYFVRSRGLRKKASMVERQFGVNYAGYLGSEKGLGEAARATIRVLREAGVPLALNNIEHRWQRSRLKTLTGLYVKESPYSINILHVNADIVFHAANVLGPAWFKGRHNIGYWLWELAEFPVKWRPSFKGFDEIWTASDFCGDSIAKVSPVPVRTIPLSIEVKTTHRHDRRYYGLNEGSFVFLYVFDLMSQFERKNPLAAISAFRKAFEGHDEKEVTLLLKFSGSKQNRWAHDAMLRAAEGLPVRFMDSHMEADKLYNLMSVSDCYVSLHRSEGFGLTIAEAMSLGKPAIATAYSGNMEFMNEENSLPVRYELRRIERNAGPYGKGNYWAEPDAGHAADLMRLVYGDRKRASEVGMAAARYMKENFSPKALKGRLEAALNEAVGTFR